MRSPSGSRSGIGLVLAIVVLLLVILLLVGVHRAFYAGTILDEAAREARGAMATTLAESALEELQHHLRTVVQDPDDPAWNAFREALTVDPADGFEIQLPLDALERTRALAASPPHDVHRFTVEADRPKVLFRKLFDDQGHGYNEIFGSLAYGVTVEASAGGPRVSRRLEATQDFKVVATLIPPPFDQIAFLLVDPRGVLGEDRVNQAARKFAEIRNAWLEIIRNALARVGEAEGRQELETLKADFEAIPDFQSGRSLSEYPPEVVHAFEFPMIAFASPGWVRERPVKGDEVDLAPNLDAWRDEVDRLDRDARSRLAALGPGGGASPGSGAPPDAPAIDELNRALERLASRLYESQQRINRWQTIFGELTGETHARLIVETGRLAAAALKKKAFFHIRESDGGGDIGLAYERFRAELTARTGSERLNGVLHIDNPGSVLDLTAKTFQGRLLIAATGAVRVGNTGRAGDADHVTIVTDGELSIEGDVHGALVANGAYRQSGAPTVTGSLVLARPVAGSLAGLTIRHDPTLAARRDDRGRYDPGIYYVGIAPRLSSMTMAR